MASRPATTVLLLTRQLIVRADFTAANKPAGLCSQMRPDVQDWAMLVEIAIGLGPKVGGRVFVLSSDLWTQTLTLPNISTKSMSQAELAAALNFEAEALSGQSAFESVVAVRTLPASEGYWIVQARSADFEQAGEIVARAGGRLGGVAHPGGVPIPLGDRAKTPRWARMEFWPDAVVLLRDEAGGPPSVQVLNSDPLLGRWKAEWGTWCEGFAATEQETLAGPGMPLTPAPTLARSFTLDDDDRLSRWLTAWATCLTAKTADVPLLRPARRPISSALCGAIAVALTALVVIACSTLHFILDAAVLNASTELKHLQDHGKELVEVKKQTADMKTHQTDLQTQLAKVESSLKVLGTHRQRLSQLLTALREIHPEDLYVDKIEVEAGEPRLRGHCIRPELADQFANKLAMRLLDHGWEVQSPKKEALKIAVSGGPWSFDIRFKGAKEMTLDTRVDTKKGKK